MRRDEKKIDLKATAYPDESDKGPFPIPDNMPIEGWPANYKRNPKLKNVTLDEVQRDKLKEDGDRHGIVVDPVARRHGPRAGVDRWPCRALACTAASVSLTRRMSQPRPAAHTVAQFSNDSCLQQASHGQCRNS